MVPSYQMAPVGGSPCSPRSHRGRAREPSAYRHTAGCALARSTRPGSHRPWVRRWSMDPRWGPGTGGGAAVWTPPVLRPAATIQACAALSIGCFSTAGRTLPFLSTPATGDHQGPPAKPLPRPGSPEAGYSLRSGDPGAPWLQRLQPGQARPGSRPGTPRDPRRGLDPAQGAPRPGRGSGPGDPHLRGTPGSPGGPVDPLLSTPRRALSGLTGRGQRTAWTWWYKSRRAPMGLLWT